MHDELVERRRWIRERRFLHALNFCMALPGPEAQQLASYIGYSLYGVRGAITSGGLFVAPSFVLLCVMSGIYVEYGDVTVVAGIVSGLGAAVVALVAAAVLRVGGRVIHTRRRSALAGVGVRGDRGRRPVPDHHRRRRGDRLPGRPLQPRPARPAGRPRRRGRRRRRGRTARRRERAPAIRQGPRDLARPGRPCSSWSAAWPASWPASSRSPRWSRSAAPTPCCRSSPTRPSTTTAGSRPRTWSPASPWASPPPGPLIMVNTFVGFVAGYNVEGTLAWGVIGATIATLATFVPCFVFIITGAPIIDRIRATGGFANGAERRHHLRRRRDRRARRLRRPPRSGHQRPPRVGAHHPRRRGVHRRLALPRRRHPGRPRPAPPPASPTGWSSPAPDRDRRSGRRPTRSRPRAAPGSAASRTAQSAVEACVIRPGMLDQALDAAQALGQRPDLRPRDQRHGLLLATGEERDHAAEVVASAGAAISWPGWSGRPG